MPSLTSFHQIGDRHVHEKVVIVKRTRMASVTDSLRVTGSSLSKTGHNRRKSARTTVHIDFDTALASEQSELNYVRQLREDIERKETDIATLRQELERNNEIDERKSPEELRRLQGAFDLCQAECHRRIDEVLKILHQTLSSLEGKRQYMKTMEEIAQERVDSITTLQNTSGVTLANLDDPKVNPINETRLKPLLQEAVKIQREFDVLHLKTGFHTNFHTRLKKFNDDIQRKLNDAISNEQRSKRRLQTVQKDIEVRCARPRIILIDSDWIDSNRSLNHNLLLLKELNAAIKMFNDEVGKLASENRNCNDKIATLREDLIALERFLPGDNSQQMQFESTQLEAENEILQMQILVAKEKLQTENDRLAQLQGMLKRMPLELEKQQTTLEAIKKDRREIDETLENVQIIRANLLSEQEFALDQKKVLEKRLIDGKSEIAKMKIERKKQKLILKKQELMIALSEEMAALRKMNLQRVAGTVQTLLKINSEMNKSGS
jgi:hypothetical protein